MKITIFSNTVKQLKAVNTHIHRYNKKWLAIRSAPEEAFGPAEWTEQRHGASRTTLVMAVFFFHTAKYQGNELNGNYIVLVKI